MKVPDQKLTATVEAMAEQFGKESAELFEIALYEVALAATQSPIEALMAAALYYAIKSPQWHGDYGTGENNCFGDASAMAWPFLKMAEPSKAAIVVWPQFPISRYRVDFLIRYTHLKGGYAFAAIECDGHNYHDLTKEQAERDRTRDRDLQAEGLLILRFTGREIHRNPLKCALRALDILEARAETVSAR